MGPRRAPSPTDASSTFRDSYRAARRRRGERSERTSDVGRLRRALQALVPTSRRGGLRVPRRGEGTAVERGGRQIWESWTKPHQMNADPPQIADPHQVAGAERKALDERRWPRDASMSLPLCKQAIDRDERRQRRPQRGAELSRHLAMARAAASQIWTASEVYAAPGQHTRDEAAHRDRSSAFGSERSKRSTRPKGVKITLASARRRWHDVSSPYRLEGTASGSSGAARRLTPR